MKKSENDKLGFKEEYLWSVLKRFISKARLM